MEVVDTRALGGILDYQPTEFTFAAGAGTPLEEIQATLREQGQHLPFDPPLAARGATLGGTLAAGLSGPGRLRHGGLRDFVLAVAWVDGRGELRRGGAPVVKNSAGFDLPKMMVGSLGRLGILTELTFKVFPHPPAFRTWHFEFDGLSEVHRALSRLARLAFDLEAVEIRPPGSVWVRLGGPEESLAHRGERLTGSLGAGSFEARAQEWSGSSEAQIWHDLLHFTWAATDHALVKIPSSLGHLLRLDQMLENLGALRRHSALGAVTWAALPPSRLPDLHRDLGRRGLSGLLLRPSHEDSPFLGVWSPSHFLRRIRSVLDPQNRFPSF